MKYKYYCMLVLAELFTLLYSENTKAQISVIYTVNTTAQRHTISPNIYGVKLAAEGIGGSYRNSTFNCFGGDRSSSFNWGTNNSNAGTDYINENDNWVPYSFNLPYSEYATPGACLVAFQDTALASGASTAITLPLIGWVANDSFGVVDTAQFAPSTRWAMVINNKGSAFSLMPDTLNDSVFVDEEMNFMLYNFGNATAATGVKNYILDNEPDQWLNRYPDIRRDSAVTYNELLTKSIALAATIKGMDSMVHVLGPELSGFYGCWELGNAADAWSYPDSWFVDTYLRTMKHASDSVGRRLLDGFTLHFYTDVDNDSVGYYDDTTMYICQDRMQCTRSLWDSTYIENSWITSSGYGNFLPILAHIQKCIDTFYPGTQLGMDGYYYGAYGHISGGIAQTDVLGILGDLGIGYGAVLPQTGYFGGFLASAFNMYLNYDGNNSKFGSNHVYASSNDSISTIYASGNDTISDTLHLIVTNKSYTDPINAIVLLQGGNIYDSIDAWYVLRGDTNITHISIPASAISFDTFRYSIPPLSIYHFVFLASCTPPSTAGTITGSSSVCVGSTVSLSDTIAGGTWLSNSPVVATINSVTGVVTGISAGIDTIYYTIVNACGSFSSAMNIIVNSIPSVIVTDSASLVTATYLAGVACQWYDNGVLIIGATNTIYAPLDSGNFNVKVTATDGCTAISDTVFYFVYESGGYYIDTCGVILAGRYIQTGIAQNGSFGSSVPLPPTIYANDTLNTCNCDNTLYHGKSLGFVADPDKDGWDVGTPPYFGDYFLPRGAFEGWAIELEGIQFNAYQSNMLSCGSPYTASIASPPYVLTGNNVAFYRTDSVLTAVWQGNLGGFLDITQTITLDTNALFFNMDIKITNLSHSPVNDVYYWRVINPQNEAKQTGNYNTNNTIDFQMPNIENTVLVTATGPTYPQAYLGLGTSDTNAKCFISETWPPTLLADQYYHMAGAGNTYCQGCADNGDFGIGLVYYIRHLAPVDSATDSVYRTVVHHPHPSNSSNFNSIYSFDSSTSDSVLFNTDSTTIVNHLTKRNPSKVYPNPTKDVINITNLNIGDHLMLTDMAGRLLRTWYADTQGSHKYSLSGLAPGSYLLNVQDNTGQIKSRDVVQKLL